MRQPSVGRIVHVVTPSFSRLSEETVCRPAIITELAEDGVCILTAFAPEGVRLVTAVYDEDAVKIRSWHWPEQV